MGPGWRERERRDHAQVAVEVREKRPIFQVRRGATTVRVNRHAGGRESQDARARLQCSATRAKNKPVRYSTATVPPRSSMALAMPDKSSRSCVGGNVEWSEYVAKRAQ